MSRLLRPFAAWIAIACLALGSLWPLATPAAVKSQVGMAICSTGTSLQTPATPGQAMHAHCMYCNGNQAYRFDVPDSRLDAFQAALAYAVTPAPQDISHPHRLREDSWARAPPA